MKKLDNEDKLLLGAGALALTTLVVFYFKGKKTQKQEVIVDEIELPAIATPPIATNPKTQPVAQLNKSKVLKFGSKGLEVRELQDLLNVDMDGDFGIKTLKALQKAKGVSEISLASFPEKKQPKIIAKPTAYIVPKKGAQLMASTNGINIFKATRLANGALINSGEKGTLTSFSFGEKVGAFEKDRGDGQFLISRNQKYYYVKRENVKAY